MDIKKILAKKRRTSEEKRFLLVKILESDHGERYYNEHKKELDRLITLEDQKEIDKLVGGSFFSDIGDFVEKNIIKPVNKDIFHPIGNFVADNEEKIEDKAGEAFNKLTGLPNPINTIRKGLSYLPDGREIGRAHV